MKLTAKYQYDNAEASTTVSGDDGTYVLDALRGNQYSITVLLPADGSIYTKAVPSEPLGNLFPPRGDRRDNTLNNLKLEDMEQREMNIGAIYPASISGTVYFDDNFSATADGSEKAVAGFTVTVRDADGNAVATTRTNGEGVYKVENLTPGDYSLDVAAVSGYAFTKRGEGNVILNRTGGQGYSELFRVELGASVTGRDIGMIRPGMIQGYVFADKNDNGLKDRSELFSYVAEKVFGKDFDEFVRNLKDSYKNIEKSKVKAQRAREGRATYEEYKEIADAMMVDVEDVDSA